MVKYNNQKVFEYMPARTDSSRVGTPKNSIVKYGKSKVESLGTAVVCSAGKNQSKTPERKQTHSGAGIKSTWQSGATPVVRKYVKSR